MEWLCALGSCLSFHLGGWQGEQGSRAPREEVGVLLPSYWTSLRLLVFGGPCFFFF